MKEPVTEFRYPMDEEQTEPHSESIEFAGRLLIYLLPSNDPRLLLAALCYACGYDLTFVLGCPANSEAAIAKTLGVTRGAFSKAVKLVCKHFVIEHVNVGKTKEVNHAETNYRLRTLAK